MHIIKRRIKIMTELVSLRPINRFFDEFFAPELEKTPGKIRVPLTDIKETASEFIFETEFPGFTQDELEVKMDRNHLTLKAEKKSSEKDDKAHFIMSERHEKFSRSFTLPEDIDADGIKATFENGLLRLTVPKKEKAVPRTIRIN